MATKYPNNYRTVSFTVTPSRGQTLKWGTTKNYREDVMQLFAAMGKRLVQWLAPYYVWIAENADHQEHIHRQEELSHNFDTIYWANYFGPGYLSPEVDELFLTAPVGIVRRLEGGLWYQLHEQFETVPEQEAEKIEAQALAHFKYLNLDRVQWRYTSG